MELLKEQYHPASIIERNDVSVRQREQLPLQAGVLYGEAPAEVAIHMNGVEFGFDLLGGQKTGAFLDQRENYARRRAVCPRQSARRLHLRGRVRAAYRPPRGQRAGGGYLRRRRGAGPGRMPNAMGATTWT